MKELRRAARKKKPLDELEGYKTTLSTGEEQILGPSVVYFDTEKIGKVTGAVGYEQLEEMGANLDAAEKLIKEAKEKKFNGFDV